MAKITSIVAQKKRGRVNIFVDGAYSFSVFENSIIDFNLFKGKEISTEEIKKITSHDSQSKALATAFRLLSFRPRSEKEIRNRLNLKYRSKITEYVIKKLKKDKYLSDESFVDFWIENRVRSRGVSLLKSELIKKGIAREIINEKILQIDEEDAYNNALKLIRLKTKYIKLEKREGIKKISAYLTRRGFSYDIIKRVLREIY